MKSVKIGDSEYRAAKNMAKKRGLFLQFLLNEAIRQYLAAQSQKEQAA